MMKSSQASVELRGMIIANDESGAVDHAVFLQAFNEFLSSKSWTFFGSTQHLETDVQVTPDFTLETE
ncbi:MULTISPECIES: hypothetical protein [Bacillaceae]|jgi:hypothetical protein|uniref:hypothetical protein n=1 Tax=Bacillaceae TaxID=186817 RepID=UPI00313BFE89